jgi:4-amino-4-deoxy-L-arabinose transferase-like glycosyltransferase
MRTRFGGFQRRLVAVAFAGAALRAFYVLVLARNVPNAGDAQYFQAAANLISEGRGFVDPFTLVAHHVALPTAAHPPLYPLALSLVSLLGGTGTIEHRLLGSLLGFVTIILIGLIARRLGGPRAGIVAAVVAALYPVLVAADGALMSETLYGLLFTSLLLLALRFREQPGVIRALTLGTLIGLAALTRSEALLLLPLLAWPLAITRPARRVALLAAMTLACLAVLTPWTIRNATTFHAFTLISHNDSTVLAGANCGPAYHGADMGAWRFDCISKRTKVSEAKQAAVWRREGVDYIRDHAGRLAAVVPVRILRTWDLWQPRRQVMYAESQARWAAKAGVVAYFLLLPAAIAGAFLLRRRRAELMILAVPAVLATLQSGAGYGNPRFRHAAEPVIVVLAGVALARVPELVRGRVPRPTMAAARGRPR